MRLRPLILAIALLLTSPLGSATAAEPPRIVVSIAPLHSLAAMVADGIAAPELLVPGGASPHSYSMRPSQARALAGADLVIWIGPGLETFLTHPLDSLAADARLLQAGQLPGLRRLPARRGGIWGTHDHDHDHDDDDHGDPAAANHDHDDHDDDHETHAEHDDHEHIGHAADRPATALDPHLWLNPANAMVMLDAIATALAELDPDHADRYRENARLGRARLAALDAALEEKLRPLAGRPFVVFHDAYQYLEERYGLTAVGAVTVSPDIQPGARRLGELRDEIARRGAVCIFAEPQFPPRVIELIADESGTAIGVLDPLGAAIAPGRDHYLTLMDQLGAAATDCLAGPA